MYQTLIALYVIFFLLLANVEISNRQLFHRNNIETSFRETISDWIIEN